MSEPFRKFKEIVKKAPDELKFILFMNKSVPQRKDKHPEGNVLKHIMIVTMRAIERFPDDMDLIMAAFFHDLGKYATLDVNPNTGDPNALGHENISAEYVEKFSDFIFDMGARPDIVYDIVKYHMLFKNLDKMKIKKQTEFYGMKNFDKIKKFGELDKGGWFKPELKENIKNKIIMEGKMIDNENIKKILHHYIDAALWTEEERLNDDYGVNNDLVYGDDDKNAFEDEIEKIVRLQSNLNKKGFEKFSREDMESNSVIKAYMDIKKFIKLVGEDVMIKAMEDASPEQIGHDLWLTRNHHGAGFFDGHYDYEIEEKLIDAAHALGEVDLYLTDNATLSFSNENILENKKNINLIKRRLINKIKFIMEQKKQNESVYNVNLLKETKKNKPNNPELWEKALSWARSRYKVCPSADCNGAESKKYKSLGGKWKKE